MTTTVRTLVVDDQRPYRTALERVVSRMDGFELVGSLTSGEEAVAQVGAYAPDFVIMDFRLGGIDGADATARILDQHPNVVVVLVSSYLPDDVDTRIRDCGATAFLPKERVSREALLDVWTSR